jgi:uncharacterized protein
LGTKFGGLIRRRKVKQTRVRTQPPKLESRLFTKKIVEPRTITSPILRAVALLSGQFEPASQPRQIVLVGGSVRAAAQDAKRAGYQIIAVDRFGDRDLLEVCDRWIPYDTASQWIALLDDHPQVPLVAVGGFEWPARAADGQVLYERLNRRLVVYPTEAVLDAIQSPARLGKIADACDVLFPETKAIDGYDERWNHFPRQSLRNQFSSHRSSGWLLKPVDHAGGYGIRLASIDEVTHKATHYLQRRVIGCPVGANFLAWNGPTGTHVQLLGAFRGITFRRCPGHPFLYGGSLGPISLPPPTTERLIRLGEMIAREFSLRGVFNLDLIISPDGALSLLEVNPRYSASMELMTCQEPGTESMLAQPSLIDWHLRAQNPSVALEAEVERWLQVDPAAARSACHCKRIVYNDPASPVISWARFTDNLHRITNANWGPTRVEVNDIPRDADAIVPGAPLCTVLVTHAASHFVAQRTSMKVAREIKNG